MTTKKIYSCGSLKYTQYGIVMLFFWILWGDFCLVLLENCRPVIVPLLLRAHDASNLTIGILCGTIPSVLNFFVNPVISTASDRLRTRLGRRIPFLLAGVPFVSLFLVLLGFSDQIGIWLAHTVAGKDAAVAPFVIGVLAAFSVGFMFFDLFAGCVYYYLFADVVPKELLGRFNGFFKVAGSCGGLLFNLLVMRHIETHMTIVCILIAVIYIVGFGGMCLKVKEGEYPPPPEHKGAGLAGKVVLYFKECFTIPFWLILFIGLALNSTSTVCRSLFNLLYAMENLHMTAGQFGQIMACGSVIIIVLSIPVGYLIDKLHPLRMFIAAGWLVVAANVFGFFFCHSYLTFFITHVLLTVCYVMQNNSAMPLNICLFPKEQYGQFASANAMIKSITLIVANALGGWFIDLLGYQYIFVWDFLWTAVSMVFLMWIYFRWKQMGGEKGYVPPTIATRGQTA